MPCCGVDILVLILCKGFSLLYAINSRSPRMLLPFSPPHYFIVSFPINWQSFLVLAFQCECLFRIKCRYRTHHVPSPTIPFFLFYFYFFFEGAAVHSPFFFTFASPQKAKFTAFSDLRPCVCAFCTKLNKLRFGFTSLYPSTKSIHCIMAATIPTFYINNGRPTKIE